MDDPKSTLPETGEFVREFDSLGAAQLAKAMLDAEGVESWLEVISISAAVPSCYRLRVGATAAHRARWILADPDVTDRELTYLATGELDPEDED
jgi:hypothetical protein